MRRMTAALLVSLALSAGPTSGEPPRVLTPDEARAAFRVEPGFEVELVAAEPLVEHPVAIDVDPEGRYWVVEMPGFMSDLAGSKEKAPSGRVVVLEDTDGDGRADKRTVFLDGLVLPRSVKVLAGGVLVGEPPHLWLAHDDDGDGRSDRKEELADDFKLWDEHPSLGPNSPVWTIDNRIAHAAWSVRLKLEKGKWVREPDLERGQWGLTQDDAGRLFYGPHDDPVKTEIVPAFQYARNAMSPAHAGIDVLVAQDRAVWPIHPTPGVNDKGKPGALRPDGSLAAFTSACGQLVYLGTAFPQAYRGNIFVCEPAGNLVHRYLLMAGGVAGARAVATPEHGAFLASTDERFRPVTLAEDRDGSMLVVDMYRGVIQHRRGMSPALHEHIEKASLAAVAGQGRIWRVAAQGAKRGALPKLSTETVAQLAERLADPSGWVRNTAQRLLVERGDASVAPALEAMAQRHRSPIARLHALNALDGLGALGAPVLTAALEDKDARVRRAALLLARRPVREGQPELTALVRTKLTDRDTASALQAALTLSESPSDEVRAALIEILVERPGSNMVVDAVVSGLAGRELDTLKRICADPRSAKERPGARRLVSLLAQCVVRTAQPANVIAVLELAGAGLSRWQLDAVVEGAYRETPSPPLAVGAVPASFEKLESDPDPQMRERVRRIKTGLILPGEKEPALSEAVQAALAAGRAAFLTRCAACHGKTGRGNLGRAPALVGSPWISRSPEIIARIVLNGKRGPAQPPGQGFPTEMPSHGPLPDAELASIIGFVRSAWGPGIFPVDPERMAAIRKLCEGRKTPWTHEELEKLEPAAKKKTPPKGTK